MKVIKKEITVYDFVKAIEHYQITMRHHFIDESEGRVLSELEYISNYHEGFTTAKADKFEVTFSDGFVFCFPLERYNARYYAYINGSHVPMLIAKWDRYTEENANGNYYSVFVLGKEVK